MPNARLIAQIVQALTRYERGELAASEVERAVSLHFPALERVGTRERNEAGHLAARLIDADLSDPTVEVNGQLLTFEGEELVADVLRDFRVFLAQLPS